MRARRDEIAPLVWNFFANWADRLRGETGNCPPTPEEVRGWIENGSLRASERGWTPGVFIKSGERDIRVRNLGMKSWDRIRSYAGLPAEERGGCRRKVLEKRIQKWGPILKRWEDELKSLDPIKNSE